ncbi:hypothetical protein BV22DRAFT_1025826 [Leucogyrophana mollusca]|uniref:Uncharacterized protein n=1 Tax=Leucogyrophana mollusca TaxID=85980 RepID=A0ACB8AY05_9AGAM|nr:hypothetical protein BV22DRAFT_1025826 [Leucogyrophana mollusca]
MLLVQPTPPTGPPGAFTLPPPSSFPPFPFLPPSSNSYSTSTAPNADLSGPLLNAILGHPPPRAPTPPTTEQPHRHASKTSAKRKFTSSDASDAPHRWGAPLPQAPPPSVPPPYRPGLTPHPSPLRPHCLARDRLKQWRPFGVRSALDSLGQAIPLPPADLARIQEVLNLTFADNTRETYGAGLLVFHVFCDLKSIHEDQRSPTPPVLLSAFIATLSGSLSSTTITNYVYGIRAWHLIHGMAWAPNDAELTALLRAANTLRPPSSKRKAHLPFTPNHILALRSQLDLSSPLHASIYACLTTTFHSTARLGEFTVKTLKPDLFDACSHVTPAHVSYTRDRNGLATTPFHPPRTKASPSGEDVSWARQDGLTDPEAAWLDHLCINGRPSTGPLFAYRFGEGHRPLTKSKFLSVLSTASKQLGVEPLKGHGIRIGSTLEYLLRGVPFDVVKVKGRWASDAFVLYLRKHAQILVPYIQASPALHDEFTHITMPPVR